MDKEKPKEEEETSEETTEDKEKDLQEQRAREIGILQNDGVFREELLTQLAQINQHLFNLNALIYKAMSGDDSKKQ